MTRTVCINPGRLWASLIELKQPGVRSGFLAPALSGWSTGMC